METISFLKHKNDSVAIVQNILSDSTEMVC
jgi:hypothetical protein